MKLPTPHSSSQTANQELLLKYSEAQRPKGVVKSKRSSRKVLGMEARLETLRGAQSTNSTDRRITIYESVRSLLNGCSVVESSSVSHTKVEEDLNARNQLAIIEHQTWHIF